jgi:adenylate kinase family enzyme
MQPGRSDFTRGLNCTPMRISVIGTSGSGKTTLAKALAAQLGLPYVEMDALNWQAGWRDLSRTDPDEFVRRVTLAIAPDAWVMDSAYNLVRDLVWRRATHLVWLDYDRPIIMFRVIRRSLVRVALRTELWAGNRERWSHMLRPSHPIRWAWNTWDRRRKDFEARIGREEYTHLAVLRLRQPRETKQLLRNLKRTNGLSALTGFRAAS